jgi:hypothetical protein
VTDEQGRRRFHGAFTGGFSAGYFNSVGSKEGWQPKTFSSSRKERNMNQFEQKIEDFMDEEDDPLLGRKLQTTDKYDTLQTHAKQALQSKQQQNQQQQQIIPGFRLPDSFVLPLSESIGKKLLIQMGWREGQGIGPRLRKKKMMTKEEMKKEQDNEEIVYVSPKNQVDLHLFPKPKLDLYGAGFDPYLNAPEFERHRKSAAAGEPYKRQIVTFADAMKSTEGSYKEAIGYGLGALEENDDIDVYGTVPMSEFDRELTHSLNAAKPVKRLDSIAQESKRYLQDHTPQVCADGRPALTGFHLSTTSKAKTKSSNAIHERIQIPNDFKAWHIFPVSEMPALYQKYNFSTEKAGRQSVVTAKQRAALLSTDTATTTGTTSVFDLLDPSQKQKLLDAAGRAKATQSTSTLSAVTATTTTTTTSTTASTMGEKFRASMSAAIANRFVSGSIQTSSGDIETNTTEKQAEQLNTCKKSYRSESTWVPDRLLCKRFHVKWYGSDREEEENKKSLFEKEIVDHVPQFGSASAIKQKIPPATSKSTTQDQEEDLPPIEPVERPQKDLLKTIFEASDESSEEEDDTNDEEEEEKKEEKERDDARLTPLANVTLDEKKNIEKISSDSSDSDSDSEEENTHLSEQEDTLAQKDMKIKKDSKKKKKKIHTSKSILLCK